jgi:uncharacterized protein (DUF736 family)
MKSSIGALWMKTGKSGSDFFSGSLSLGALIDVCRPHMNRDPQSVKEHERVEIVVFENGYKKEDKHPDWCIYLSQRRNPSAMQEPY